MQTLPITVIVAVTIFIIKEVFEWIRRFRADERKRSAFRTMLARECELNHWTLKVLQRAIAAIGDAEESPTIKKGAAGDEVFVTQGGSYPIPKVHTEIMSKLMIDVATIDQSLFPKLEQAYDESINLRHIRDSLIKYVSSDDEMEHGHLTVFAEYATSEISDITAKLSSLYFECTGKRLIEHRVR